MTTTKVYLVDPFLCELLPMKLTAAQIEEGLAALRDEGIDPDSLPQSFDGMNVFWSPHRATDTRTDRNSKWCLFAEPIGLADALDAEAVERAPKTIYHGMALIVGPKQADGTYASAPDDFDFDHRLGWDPRRADAANIVKMLMTAGVVGEPVGEPPHRGTVH